MKKPKIKIVEQFEKGLDIYKKPYEIVMNKERNAFYYSEVGLICSCRFYEEKYKDAEYLEREFLNPAYWLPRAGKFGVNIQYDYRYAENQDTFNYKEVSKSGSRSEEVLANTIEEAIEKMIEFFNKPFDKDQKATIRETALFQSLHHNAAFARHRSKPDFYEEIILNSKYADKYKQYIKHYENRSAAEQKYRNKLHARFSEVFGQDLKKYVHHFNFNLFHLTRNAGIKDEEIKAHPNFNLLKKVAQYYK